MRAPEVISVHIPRTAGVTFTNVLRTVYGEEAVETDRTGQTPAARALREDFDAWNREVRAAVGRRSEWPKAVTGHVPLSVYERIRRSAFTIVWLREPAARLISSYFYLRGRASRLGAPIGGFASTAPPERIMEVEWPRNPVTGWFLRGYDLEDFDFVGVQEFFADDIADLGRMLGWPPVEVPVHNRTTTSEYVDFRPSNELVQKIRAANHEDVDLYKRALELRHARLAAGGRSA